MFSKTLTVEHIKKAITILFIFATENARIIVIIQKANANLIDFFSIDQPFTYAMLVRMRSSFDVKDDISLGRLLSSSSLI